MGKSFDCSGWATKANMRCADGRVIMKNAFKECDGMTVPVVWNHQHNSVDEVLGHALLENRDEGVYAYVNFNDTESGQNAKLVVQHGDVNRFSIYANKLKQQGSNVIHGVIRELSLVLAGANPGAVIETVMMHGEDSYEEGYITPDIIYCIENVEPLFHADTEKKGEEEMAKETTKPEGEETIKDVFDTLTEKQKKAVYAMIGMALEDDNDKGNENEKLVSLLVLRTMQLAKYSNENIGHFGLASEYYCHFTSPIRRYPDLFIHRVISSYLANELDSKMISKYKKQAIKYAETSSEMEQEEEEAERDLYEIKKCEFMQKHVGEIYDGSISGVTSFGIFVELENTVEGLIRLENMKDDYYVYDENCMRLIGKRTNKIFKLGDKVKVKVVSANKLLRRIDFELID